MICWHCSRHCIPTTPIPSWKRGRTSWNWVRRNCKNLVGIIGHWKKLLLILLRATNSLVSFGFEFHLTLGLQSLQLWTCACNNPFFGWNFFSMYMMNIYFCLETLILWKILVVGWFNTISVTVSSVSFNWANELLKKYVFVMVMTVHRCQFLAPHKMHESTVIVKRYRVGILVVSTW